MSEVADFVEGLPKTKFDMRMWFIPRRYDAEANLGLLIAIDDVVQPGAHERDWSCVTNACLAGWTMVYATQVKPQDPANPLVVDGVDRSLARIDHAASDYLVGDLPEDGEQREEIANKIYWLFFETALGREEVVERLRAIDVEARAVQA